ncbi:MAG TPA: hypothetical protein VHK01_14205 [Lacipirellulaceae bacterium]|nr:hypothetical protein [Lacipirellulaceae bacterium]
MAFSIKQLLFSMAVVAFGLVAMLSEYRPHLGKLFDLLTLGILIAVAYGVWLASGERRAFRIGFLCWALLYFFLFKKTLDVGISELITRAYRAVSQPVVVLPPGTGGGGIAGGGFGGGGAWPIPYGNFAPVFHSMFLLLLGVIGGWVTVYVYRKRERMVARRTP